MHPEIIRAWLSDLPVIAFHSCADSSSSSCTVLNPATAETTLTPRSPQSSSPARRSLTSARRQILGDVDVNLRCLPMANEAKGKGDPGEQRLRSPRKRQAPSDRAKTPYGSLRPNTRDVEVIDLSAATSSNVAIVYEDDDIDATPRPLRARATRAYEASLNLEGLGSIPRLDSTSSLSSRSTRSSRTRSSSPVKHGLDLQMLPTPVNWKASSEKEIRNHLQACPDVVQLFGDIRRVARCQRYLPVELKAELQEILDVDEDNCFDSKRPVAQLTEAIRADLRGALRHILQDPQVQTTPDTQLQAMAHHLQLLGERRVLEKIVGCTSSFRTSSRSEAAWNARVHEPLLQLAVESCRQENNAVNGDESGRDLSKLCWAEAENVTRANIARPFLPVTHGAGSAGGGEEATANKMIDFAIALSAPLPPTEIGAQPNSLFKTIYRLVNSLPHKFFNQTPYEPLVFNPTGVFIETKVDSRQYAEAQNQLGIWLSSWFGRIRALRENLGRSYMHSPCIPVLLVVADAWQLWFAHEQEGGITVVGPLNCGGTSTLDDAYRLFAVLRLLIKWVGQGGFRQWVEELVGLRDHQQ